MRVKSLILFVLVFTSAFLFFLLAAAIRRARAGGRTRSFAGLCAAGFVYSLGYIVELLAPDLAVTLIGIRIEYVGIALIPAFLLLMLRDFEGDTNRRIPAFLLFVIPAVTLALVFTMGAHSLYYIDPSIRFENGLTILSFERAPMYWVFNVYKFAAIAYGVFAFARLSFKGPRSRRAQALYMLTGCVLPWLANFFYIARKVPLGLDPSPMALAVTAGLFGIGFFRHGLLDLRPIARDTVFEQMRDAVLVTDSEGRIVDHNESARGIFPALTGRPGARHIGDLEALSQALPAAPGEPGHAMAVSLILPEGERHYDLHRSILLDRFGKQVGNAHVLMDVTERAMLEERLSALASTDELTGVPNRRSFFERTKIELDRAQRYGRPFGVAILDLDDFKVINDRYGHPAGDEALRLAANLCAGTLRSADIMGRFGGDEFAFAFPECDEAGAWDAANRLAGILGSAVFPYGSDLIRLSASVGAAGAAGPPLPELGDLLKLADERMYAKKNRGAPSVGEFDI